VRNGRSLLRKVMDKLVGQKPSATEQSAPASLVAEQDDVLSLIRFLPEASGLSTVVVSASNVSIIVIEEADVTDTTAEMSEQVIRSNRLVVTAPSLPPLPRLVLYREDIPEVPSYRLDAADFIRPTQIERPGDKVQVGNQRLDICGQAEPGSRLQLRVGELEQTVESNAEGAFLFASVPLQEGWNNIYVLSLTYPDFDPCHCVVQVYRHFLPYIGRRDTYTGSLLGPTDEVVRCQKCQNYARLESWQRVGCTNWTCKSANYWTKDDPAFFTEESPIEM
jgi:hypothetical protein